jgi:hypothetical protein
LVERRDFMELVPVCAYREFFGYGKCKASDVPIHEISELAAEYLKSCHPDAEVWVAMTWRRFEDGYEESGITNYFFDGGTEKDARVALARLIRFRRMSKVNLEALGLHLEPDHEDSNYIENRFPNFQSPPTGPNSTAAHDVYQARLKVLAGLQPKTVDLIRRFDAAKEPGERLKLERETVQSYFAELANEWTEDEVLAWQRNNPVGTTWLCEFGRVMAEPEREIDPINHELAFNWLRRKYHLLTAAELSDAILVATGQRVASGTLKKRRERLGLTTDRPPGPPPNESQ